MHDNKAARRRSQFTWVGKQAASTTGATSREDTLAQLVCQLHDVNSYAEIGHLVGRSAENIRIRILQHPTWRGCIVGGGKHMIPRNVAAEIIESLMLS